MSHELDNASQLIEKGEIAQARMLIKRMLQQDIENVDAWYLLIQVARDDGEKRKAAERILALQPDHLQAQQILDELEEEAIASLGDLLTQPKTTDLFDDDIFNIKTPVKRKTQAFVSPAKSNVWAFATVAVLFLMLIALLVVFSSQIDNFSFGDSESLEIFETISQVVEIDNNDEAEIEINATGLFTITAEGIGEFDPVLFVYNSENDEIGYNDDHITSSTLDSLDAQIEYIYIDGYARIEITEYWDEDGRALLTVESTTIPVTNDSVLEMGQSETFDIDVSEWFEINIGERRTVTIIVKSEDNDFDPVLEIFDEDFSLIEYNDDHDTNYDYLDDYDSVIEDVRLSGRVYIRVSDFSGIESGDVTISVK